MMRKALFTALVIVFLFAMAGAAFAAGPVLDPSNETSYGASTSGIDPATGLSIWSYQDLQDASPKYEGGYAAFNNGSETTYAVNPHGGYNTTTNKCKVCHAVHRAEGAYYLLRSDSQDDACSYCHIGSAHSTKVVYDLNPDGIYTMNGHTIGAQTQIPDSTTKQVAQAVVLSTTDATGNPISETIHVRAYESEKNEMYRFARHHGQSAVSESWADTTTTIVDPTDGVTKKVSGSARGGYIKVGPLALRCMSCHQPHNAVGEVWRPKLFVPWTSANYASVQDTDTFDPDGYKLLRRAPSGTTTGTPWTTSLSGGDTFYQASQVVKAIESNALPGVNFSQHESAEAKYTENGVLRSQPIWIAQGIHASAVPTTGVYRYPNKVNNMALSWWCADCHNLNIGGWEPLTDPELGFKAHTERTHAAPYYGAYGGPSQCFSCHRNDLAVQMGLAATATANFGGTGRATPLGLRTSSSACSQCHYGTGDYYVERVVNNYPSDFPHSGKTTDIKMLGSYSVVDSDGNPSVGSWSPVYSDATVTATTLDQVCLRCHPGIGFNH
ncbi:MAG: hypothetical protein C0418_02355 [Coriobacteriaceae bacterium]|nr:hypothetical protein [Coriobacteriaceae bacterium]